MRSLVLEILSRAAGKRVEPGEQLDVTFDYAMVHDGSVVLAAQYIEERGVRELCRPDRAFLIFDHIWPPNTERTADIHRRSREFGQQYGLRFYEGGSGICHQIILEDQTVQVGSLLAGGDSHTPTIGARGCLGIGFGAMDMANILTEGTTWLKIPEIIRLNLKGEPPEGVMAKDVALGIAGTFGTDFATYRAIEFASDHSFTLSGKAVLCNMATEFGAKTAVFLPPDWDDAGSDEVVSIDFDLDELEPLVALPHSVGNVQAASSVSKRIDVAVVGTCTGGRMEDFRAAAEAMEGSAAAPHVRLLICPASRRVYQDLCREGLAEFFVNAGATVLPPSCGPCLGMHMGVLAAGEVCISTANRNFVGRMGSKNAEIFLASPATVGRSAVEGMVAAPSCPRRGHWKGERRSVPRPSDKGAKPSAVILKDIGFDADRNRIWRFGDHIDTDQIISGKYLRTTDQAVWGEHAFEAVCPEFRRDVRPGDVIVAGENFGCGSSREQAAIALKLCGIRAVIARSYGRIFYRNCINVGLELFSSAA